VFNGAPQPFLWYLFDQAEAHFEVPSPSLRLGRREQEVAYLYYLENATVHLVARTLGVRPDAVTKTLQRIRVKSERRVLEISPTLADSGARTAGYLARYLREHPGEIALARDRLEPLSDS